MEVLTARLRPSSAGGDERRRESGFSLVELLAAILIVAFVVLGVLSAFGQGVRFNSSSRDYTAVSNLAKSHLEELIALPFNTPAVDPALNPHILTSPDGRFGITYTIQEFAITSGTPDPNTVMAGTQAVGAGNIKRITLTVTPVNGTAPGLREVTVEGVKHVR